MIKKAVKTTLITFLCALGGLALAATFQRFTPATGILVGDSNSPVTTAATSANVISLWTGTCNSSALLKGDGTCAAIPTGATGADPTATIGASAVNGVATTFMRSDAAPALPATLPALSGTNLTSLNGTNISSGTVADARLSSNIPLKNAANTYSYASSGSGDPGAIFASTRPVIQIYDTDVNDDRFVIQNNAGDFRIDAINAAASVLNSAITINQTAGVVDTINLAGTNVTINGSAVAAATTGTFTMTISSGCTTNPTATASWFRNGNTVTLRIPTITCTSNDNTLQTTGLPNALRPTNQQNMLIEIVDNGVNEIGTVSVVSSLTVLTYNRITGVLTNSGTKGFRLTSVTWAID